MAQQHMSLEQALEYGRSLTKDQQEVFEIAFVAGVQKQTQSSVDRAVNASADDKHYVMGWNSGLEMVAYRLTNDFKHAFGEDTLASIASWIKGQKK